MGGIGAHSPGMVFIEKPARFTPIAERRRRFSRNLPFTGRKPDIGAHYRPKSEHEETACLAIGVQFFRGFTISPGRHQCRSISVYLIAHGGPNP